MAKTTETKNTNYDDELAERVTRLELLLTKLYREEIRVEEEFRRSQDQLTAQRAEEVRLRPIRVEHVRRFIAERCVLDRTAYCCHLELAYRAWCDFSEVPQSERITGNEQFDEIVRQIEPRVTTEIRGDLRTARLNALVGITAQPRFRSQHDPDFPDVDKRYTDITKPTPVAA